MVAAGSPAFAQVTVVSRTTHSVVDRAVGRVEPGAHQEFTQTGVGFSTGAVRLAGVTPSLGTGSGAFADQISRVSGSSITFLAAAAADPQQIPFNYTSAETSLVVEFVVTEPTLLHAYAHLSYAGSARATATYWKGVPRTQ